MSTACEEQPQNRPVRLIVGIPHSRLYHNSCQIFTSLLFAFPGVLSSV